MTEAKFKIGQIVVMDTKKKPPFRIVAMEWSDGWFYAYNAKNFISELMIRKLTPEEIG